jgi:hypothetical protein
MPGVRSSVSVALPFQPPVILFLKVRFSNVREVSLDFVTKIECPQFPDSMDVVMIRELSFGPLIVKDTSGKIISDTVNVPVKPDKSMMSPELAPCIADFKDSVDRVVGVIVSADRDTVAMVDNPVDG